MNVLLKAAKIVDPANPDLHRKKRDIHIKNGTIQKIGSNISPMGKVRIIEKKNLHVSAGWFDSSVSFGEPGFEERETIANGLMTASRSGFTALVLNPNTHPVPDSSSDIIFLKSASSSQPATLYPLGSLSVKSEGRNLAELYDMHKAGAVGFYDFKKPVKNANLLKIALLYAQNFHGLIMSFPLDSQIAAQGIVNEGKQSVRLGLKGIPALAEELQIARDLYILEYTGGRLHIPTISSSNAVKLIADAKKKGLDVSCSVALHNLYATDETLAEFDTNFKTMPPLRTQTDAKTLARGVRDGTIDFVTSDHSPMDIEEKRVEFDNAAYGTLGLESAFGTLLKLYDLDKTISLLTKGRARFGIPEIKIKEGNAADLALFDPNPVYTFSQEHLLSTSKNSLFIGSELKGKVFGTIARGKVCLIN
jgi:dihydroorotase